MSPSHHLTRQHITAVIAKIKRLRAEMTRAYEEAIALNATLLAEAESELKTFDATHDIQ